MLFCKFFKKNTQGLVIKAKNTMKKSFNANDAYYFVRVADETGDEFFLALTEHEIKEAKERASKNSEDVPVELL